MQEVVHCSEVLGRGDTTIHNPGPCPTSREEEEIRIEEASVFHDVDFITPHAIFGHRLRPDKVSSRFEVSAKLKR